MLQINEVELLLGCSDTRHLFLSWETPQNPPRLETQSFNSIHSTLRFSRFRSYRIPHPRHRTRTIELHTGVECSRAHPRARTALSLHTSSVSMALVLSYVTRRSHSSPWTASLSSGERRQSPFNVAFAKA